MWSSWQLESWAGVAAGAHQVGVNVPMCYLNALNGNRQNLLKYIAVGLCFLLPLLQAVDLQLVGIYG